jgi:hypothetical protein
MWALRLETERLCDAMYLCKQLPNLSEKMADSGLAARPRRAGAGRGGRGKWPERALLLLAAAVALGLPHAASPRGTVQASLAFVQGLGAWTGNREARVAGKCFAPHMVVCGRTGRSGAVGCLRPRGSAARRSPCSLLAGPQVEGEAHGGEDDLGALLRTWGVEDARAVLEANGFTSVKRMRDVLEVDDLPELGLPLATRKILARLLMSWADEKEAEQDAHLTQKVASLLELRPKFASQEEADAATAEEARQSVLYNSDAPKTIRRWQSFHRVISEKIATAAGSFQLRAVEEIQLDAPVNEEALNTSLVPPPSGDEDRLRDTESLSGGRGGRYEAARKKLLAPPPPVAPGEKQKRHFRYRSREGDFFVKVVLTGEIADSRGDDEKEDALGDLLGVLSRGDLEADNVAGLGVDFDSLISSMTSMSLGQGGVGNGNGGLILAVPDGFEEKLFGAQDKSVQALAYPHNLYEGEQVSLKTLRSTGQMRMPAPIVAGQEEFLKSPVYSGLHTIFTRALTCENLCQVI